MGEKGNPWFIVCVTSRIPPTINHGFPYSVMFINVTSG